MRPARRGEPFTSLLVDGRCGPRRCRQAARCARGAGARARQVHGIVVLDTAAKADFAEFQRRRLRRLPRAARCVRSRCWTASAPALPSRRRQRQRCRRSNRCRSAHGKAPAVLLVEDNDVNALLARRMLEKAGCEVRLPSTAARRWKPSAACSPAPRRPSTRADGPAHAGARRPRGDPRHPRALCAISAHSRRRRSSP